MVTKDGGKETGGGRRKPDPITIDLKASSVRVDGAPKPEATSPETPETAPPAAAAAEPAVSDTPAEPAATATPAAEEPVATVAPAPVQPDPEPVAAAAPEPEPPTPAQQPEPAQPAAASHDHPSAAAPPPERPRGRLAQTLVAALIGGAIGLIGAYGLAGAGLWPGSPGAAITAQVAEQKAMIASLEKKLTDIANAPKPAVVAPETVAGVDSRLKAVEGKLGTSATPIADILASLDGVSRAVDGQKARAGVIESEIDRLKRLPEIPGLAVSEVEKILDPFTSRVTAAVAHVDQIDTKIAGEQAIVRGEAKSTQDSVLARIGEVETSVGNRLGKMEQDVSGRLAAVEGVAKATADRTEATAKTAAKLVADLDALDKRQAGDIVIARAETREAANAAATHFAMVDSNQRIAAAGLEERAAVAQQQQAALEALAAKFTDLDKRTAADLAILRGTINNDINTLRGTTGEFAIKTSAILNEMDATLKTAVKQLADTTATATETRKQATESRDAIVRIDGRLAALDDLRRAIDGLGAHIGALEEMRKVVDAQGARLGGIDEAKKISEGVAASLWIIDQRMANVQARLVEIDQIKATLLNDANRIAALDSRIAPVETKVASVDSWARQGVDARQQAVSAIALANLKSAVDAGRPFVSELASAKAIIRDLVDLSPLDAFAAKGMATETELAQRFARVAPQIMETITPATTGDGVLNTLMSHATQAVKIRPAGDASGEGPEARVSRIEARLNSHDLAGALSEWQGLPDPARQISADWGTALKARVDGAKLLASITDQVLAKLNAVSQ